MTSLLNGWVTVTEAKLLVQYHLIIFYNVGKSMEKEFLEDFWRDGKVAYWTIGCRNMAEVCLVSGWGWFGQLSIDQESIREWERH
jgi:hypothetical protein